MKKILVRGPILTRTGYGEHARFVLRSLRTVEDKYDIYVLPVTWGQSSWVWEDNEERQWLDSLIKKTALHQHKNGTYDASIQVTIPNEWQKMAPVNIGVTAGIETTRVAPEWIQKTFEVDRMAMVSNHSKNVFNSTAYEAVNNETGEKVLLQNSVPIDVVHYPVKKYKKVDLDFKLDTSFNFLTVAQWGPRKNIANTVKWFVEEFFDNPEVGLVVKTFKKGGFVLDRKAVTASLQELLGKYKDRKCKVYLLHGDLKEQEMHSLYTHPKIKALVSLSHGEGFGLPHFEAAYSGLPIIAPEWSGYTDFLSMPVKDKKGRIKNKPHFVCVEYDLKPIQKEAVWKGVLEKDSMWCYPQQGSYKMRLREVYKDFGRFKKQAKELQSWVLENFSEKKQYSKFVESIDSVNIFDSQESVEGEINTMFDELLQKSGE